jgi:insertion element IS1 protein InsB
MLTCPECQSTNLKKNGHIHNGKQRYVCKACGRQFTPEGTKKTIGDEIKTIIDALLLEKLSLAGIARAVHVSETWLQEYVNAKYEAVEKQVKVPVKKGL